jgi:hypothetical protein
LADALLPILLSVESFPASLSSESSLCSALSSPLSKELLLSVASLLTSLSSESSL